jgi:hypothetical protein
MILERIISGAQTGADRGGLDVALALGIPTGGWCPKGRRAEDGKIPDKYVLMEATSSSYPQRTFLNVRGSDGTVIFTRGAIEAESGCALTAKYCRAEGKPCISVDLGRTDFREAAAGIRKFIVDEKIKTLNVAGSRESKAPGIALEVKRVLELALGDQREA